MPLHETKTDSALYALENLVKDLQAKSTEDGRRGVASSWKTSSMISDDSLHHTMKFVYAKRYVPEGTIEDAIKKDMEELMKKQTMCVETEQVRLERCKGLHASLTALLMKPEGVKCEDAEEAVKREEDASKAGPNKRVKRE